MKTEELPATAHMEFKEISLLLFNILWMVPPVSEL